MRPRWSSGPAELVLVRHGESVGNDADAQAREAGAETWTSTPVTPTSSSRTPDATRPGH